MEDLIILTVIIIILTRGIETLVTIAKKLKK